MMTNGRILFSSTFSRHPPVSQTHIVYFVKVKSKSLACLAALRRRPARSLVRFLLLHLFFFLPVSPASTAEFALIRRGGGGE